MDSANLPGGTGKTFRYEMRTDSMEMFQGLQGCIFHPVLFSPRQTVVGLEASFGEKGHRRQPWVVVQFEKSDSYQGFASAMPIKYKKRNGFSRWPWPSQPLKRAYVAASAARLKACPDANPGPQTASLPNRAKSMKKLTPRRIIIGC